jgi:hypothetical protein
MKIFKIVLLIALLIFSFTGYSQCKNFAKKSCVDNLAPFQHNGQLNRIIMRPGENAELPMVFYSGQDYRLQVCGQPNLGELKLRVYDRNHKEIYNNTTSENNAHWDFNVASTQQLFIEVEVPESASKTDLMQSGCVVMLVGFKL